MIRECNEEVGIITTNLQWNRLLKLIIPNDGNVIFFYSINDDIFLAKQMESEEIAIFEVSSLPSNIIYNLKWLIPMCLDDKLDHNHIPEIFESI